MDEETGGQETTGEQAGEESRVGGGAEVHSGLSQDAGKIGH